ASDALPDRWMTGTQNHEGIAGVTAAVDYLAAIAPGTADRRGQLRAALTAIQAYEAELSSRLLRGLAGRRRFKVWGITVLERVSERVPTVSITTQGRSAADLATHLAARRIQVWNGNMYALELTER